MKNGKKEPIYARHPYLLEPLPEALLIRKREKEGKPITPVFRESPFPEKQSKRSTWVKSHMRKGHKVSGHYRKLRGK